MVGNPPVKSKELTDENDSLWNLATTATQRTKLMKAIVGHHMPSLCETLGNYLNMRPLNKLVNWKVAFNLFDSQCEALQGGNVVRGAFVLTPILNDPTQEKLKAIVLDDNRLKILIPPSSFYKSNLALEIGQIHLDTIWDRIRSGFGDFVKHRSDFLKFSRFEASGDSGIFYPTDFGNRKLMTLSFLSGVSTFEFNVAIMPDSGVYCLLKRELINRNDANCVRSFPDLCERQINSVPWRLLNVLNLMVIVDRKQSLFLPVGYYMAIVFGYAITESLLEKDDTELALYLFQDVWNALWMRFHDAGRQLRSLDYSLGNFFEEVDLQTLERLRDMASVFDRISEKELLQFINETLCMEKTIILVPPGRRSTSTTSSYSAPVATASQAIVTVAPPVTAEAATTSLASMVVDEPSKSDVSDKAPPTYDLRWWLDSCNMLAYYEIFELNGFGDDWHSLAEINEDDLKSMGIEKLGHRKSLMHMARNVAIEARK